MRDWGIGGIGWQGCLFPDPEVVLLPCTDRWTAIVFETLFRYYRGIHDLRWEMLCLAPIEPVLNPGLPVDLRPAKRRFSALICSTFRYHLPNRKRLMAVSCCKETAMYYKSESVA